MTDDRAALAASLLQVLGARLAAVVVARQHIIVCGATGAAKTSLLRGLSNEVPPARRLVRP